MAAVQAPPALDPREACNEPAARPAARWRALGPALAASLALVAALGGYMAGRAGDDPELADLVAGYQRAALAGQPIDVASSDRHTVKPWLATRAPIGARVVDLAAEGFPLLGGRIDVVEGRPVPTLVYRRREHLISVSELPLAQAGERRGDALGLPCRALARRRARLCRGFRHRRPRSRGVRRPFPQERRLGMSKRPALTSTRP